MKATLYTCIAIFIFLQNQFVLAADAQKSLSGNKVVSSKQEPATQQISYNGHKFATSIIKQYDIRGQFNLDLFPKDAYFLGKSFATFLMNGENDIVNPKVVVGYDGRVSSPELYEQLVLGLRESGVNVISLGMVSTPMFYFATHHFTPDGGVMITASHNPATYNGFKVTLANAIPVYGENLKKIAKIAESGEFKSPSELGNLTDENIKQAYLTKVISAYKNKKRLKIVWDCANSVSCIPVLGIVPRIYGNHKVLYSHIDGTFPNHPADPAVAQNLQDLAKTVTQYKFDFGIGFDGDGDRIGIVDNQGRVIPNDEVMMILAADILKNNPGGVIVGDVKMSQAFFNYVKDLGGVPIMTKTGHSFIKEQIAKNKAVLAGEVSGHVFYNDGNYYGYDDAMYAALRLIDIMQRNNVSLSSLVDKLPHYYTVPVINIPVDEKNKPILINNLINELKANNVKFNDIDGARVENNSGWWLIRASNTEHVLTVRYESYTKEDLPKVEAEINNYLSKIFKKPMAVSNYIKDNSKILKNENDG